MDPIVTILPYVSNICFLVVLVDSKSMSYVEKCPHTLEKNKSIWKLSMFQINI